MKRPPLQRRPHPIFSPLAWLSTLILAGGLALALWLTGGRAFSPGRLSAANHGGAPLGDVMSHAEVNDTCAACHAPFQGIDAARCLACHQGVARERATGGLHGRLAAPDRCADCHAEHQGADFDLLLGAITGFDHDLASFSLARHAQDYHALPLGCGACHPGPRDFALAPTACADCHAAADPAFMAAHLADFDPDCVACHDGLDTVVRLTVADHARYFSLAGAHAAAACAGCHQGADLAATPVDCAGCHADPPVHAGVFGDDCAGCHTPDGWQPATLDGRPFNHTQDTRFTLASHVNNLDGQPFSCLSCHQVSSDFTFTDSQCRACHDRYQATFMEEHVAQMGGDCLTCHDGSGVLASFDHDRVWPLTGRHAATPCADCHTERQFAGAPRECVACHVEPPIHVGLFGTDCAACHTADGWSPAQLRQHRFPLDHGGEGEIPCTTCHTDTYVTYTCTNCHAHDPVETAEKHLEEGISPAELPDCAVCHPTGREDEAET